MKHLLIVLMLISSATAYSADYLFDKVHTQIFFNVSHLGFSRSTGAFTDFTGNFSFNENDFSQSKVEVTIQTDSIDLNDKAWNKHMQGTKWFDVKQYPKMTFKSRSVKKTGDKTMDVIGDLTIKGVTKPVTLAVTFNKAGEAFGQQKAGFSATATIDRTEFGMDKSVPAVGTDILISIEVEGVKV
ncbi:MAG: YceI family protein [Pseudomonadota bacterium]